MDKTQNGPAKTRRTNQKFRFNNTVKVIRIDAEGRGQSIGNTYKTRTRAHTVKNRPNVKPQTKLKYVAAVLSAHAFAKGDTLEDMIDIVQKSKAAPIVKKHTIHLLQRKFPVLSAKLTA